MERALEAAEEAVREFEEKGWRHGATTPDEALEAVLGPLDWSFGGRGFRLLRRLLRRVDA